MGESEMASETADLIGEILGLVRGQARVLRRLLKLMAAERAALLAPRMEAIRDFGARKEALLEECRVLEADRLARQDRLAELMEVPSEQLTLSTLAAVSAADQAAELSRVRNELCGLVDKLQAENRRSRRLCRDGLAVVQGAFAALKGLAAADAVYRRTGRMQDARMSGRVLNGQV
jgi:flagellar biosynthesis/type III secretory pathway chaperone